MKGQMWALTLVRLGLGAFMLATGISKLLGLPATPEMVGSMAGLSGTVAIVAGWAVIVFEVLGGLFVLLGKWIGKFLYKISLLGHLIILLVATIGVHILAGPDFMTLLNHLLLMVVIIALLISSPMCPLCAHKK